MARLSIRLSLLSVSLLGTLTACEKVKSTFRSEPDTRWQSDSVLLEARPAVLFRVMPRGDTAAQVVPIATMGPQGLRELRMARRGWRAFDLEYLHSPSTIVPIRDGKAANGMRVIRGMWQPSPVDSIPCPVPVPFAYAMLSDARIGLATSGPLPPLRHSRGLGTSELAEAIENIPRLIAPTIGVSTSMLQRYERRVHQVTSGSGDWPTVVVVYDDPEVPHDTLPVIGQRPRHFIVILDRGVYGYKTSWTYQTVGNRNTMPRLKFLDYVDVNGDGLAEVFFGLRDYPGQRYTLALRFESDAWREQLLYLGRQCE